MSSAFESLSTYLESQQNLRDERREAQRKQQELEQKKRALQEEVRRTPVSDVPRQQELSQQIQQLDTDIANQKTSVVEHDNAISKLNMKAMNKAAGATDKVATTVSNDLSKITPSLAEAYFSNSMPHNKVDPTGESTHLRNQAQLSQQAAGDLQKAQQQESQIANRDTKTEADKKAIAQGGVKATQIQQQLGAETGAAAGLEGMKAIENANYNYEEGRADQARQRAVERNKDVYDQRQNAEEALAEAGRSDYIASNEDLWMKRADALARGSNTPTINVNTTTTPPTKKEDNSTTKENKVEETKVEDESRPGSVDTTETTPITPEPTQPEIFEEEAQTSDEVIGTPVDNNVVNNKHVSNGDPHVAGGDASTFSDEARGADTNAGFTPDPEKSMAENLAAKGTFGESPATWLDINGNYITIPESAWKEPRPKGERGLYWYWDPTENNGKGGKVWTNDKKVSIPGVRGAQNIKTFDMNGKAVSDGNLKNIIKSLVDCSRF